MSGFRTELDLAFFNHLGFYITCITRHHATIMHKWFYTTGRSVFLPWKTMTDNTYSFSINRSQTWWLKLPFFLHNRLFFWHSSGERWTILKQRTVIASNSWSLPSVLNQQRLASETAEERAAHYTTGCTKVARETSCRKQLTKGGSTSARQRSS